MIGRGVHRECYTHPDDQNLCIKVIVKDCPVEIKREQQYYRHLQKRGISWDMIPRYYGDVETNLGPGSVFDLIVDHDLAVSKSLEYYLSFEEQTEKYYESLSKSLHLLKKYLLDNNIVTMNLKTYNILCQKNESRISRLFLVDNIYNSEFIPISNYNNYFAKLKINRKWQRFENSMRNEFKDNKALERMLTGPILQRSTF